MGSENVSVTLPLHVIDTLDNVQFPRILDIIFVY